MFNQELRNMDFWVDSDETDSRVELIIDTNLMLDNMLKDLASYQSYTKNINKKR